MSQCVSVQRRLNESVKCRVCSSQCVSVQRQPNESVKCRFCSSQCVSVQRQPNESVKCRVCAEAASCGYAPPKTKHAKNTFVPASALIRGEKRRDHEGANITANDS